MASSSRPRASPKPSRSIHLPTRPEPRIRWVWFIRGALLALLYSLVFTFPLIQMFVFSRASSEDLGFGEILRVALIWYAIVWAAILLIIYLWTGLAARRYSFEIGDEDVLVRKGVIFRTSSRIPLLKVQDIHVRQGPLLRMFGLSSLKLETAGSVAGAGGYGASRFIGAEGQLPGIRDAEPLAHELLQRVKALRGGL